MKITKKRCIIIGMIIIGIVTWRHFSKPDKSELLAGHRFGETENQTAARGEPSSILGCSIKGHVSYAYGDKGLYKVQYDIYKDDFSGMAAKLKKIFGQPIKSDDNYYEWATTLGEKVKLVIDKRTAYAYDTGLDEDVDWTYCYLLYYNDMYY